MADLDNLERLHRLREEGAITDEEYTQAKAKLLTPAKPRILTAALIAIGAVLVVAFGLWFSQSAASSSEPNALEAASLTQSGSTESKIEGNVASLDETASLYRWATSSEVIGLNPDYLETRLGVPREKSEGYRTFDVAGCPIFFWTEGSEVKSFSAPVTDRCHPNGVTHKTTFGAILAKAPHGQFHADCLANCGNAADPDIELLYPGARANGFIDESFSSTSLLGESGDSFGLWANEVRRAHGFQNDDYSADPNIFSCVRNPPASVVASLRPAKVQTVRIGRDLHANCE